MKKIHIVLSAGAALLLVLGIAQAASTKADGQDRDRPSRTIRLTERIHEFAFQDAGAPGPSLGDRLIFTSDLFDEDNHLVGRDGADCVVVRLDPSAPPPV